MLLQLSEDGGPHSKLSKEDAQRLVAALQSRADTVEPGDPGVYGGDEDVAGAWVRWAVAGSIPDAEHGTRVQIDCPLFSDDVD